jgi:trans-aconitate 2-methyltransferase
MPTADSWSPDQYSRFRSERSRPFFDLLRMVDRHAGMTVVDLGCGTGELTAELHRSLGASETLGVDNSAAMLERADKVAQPGLRFELADIAGAIEFGSYDLIFSNAALHWLPDHPHLLERLTARLRSGGQLAVQVPANHNEATHTVAALVAAQEPFRTALDGYVAPTHVLEPVAYARLLYSLGYVEQRVELRVYGHVLDSREGVVEWVKGTTLTVYRERLDDEMYAAFLAEYRSHLLTEVADEQPFFFPFHRILFWARQS